MTHTREEYFKTGLEAAKAIIDFGLMCMEHGGDPRSRNTDAKGDYLCRTWYCYGAAEYVHPVKICAPMSDPRWRALIERLEKEYGDFRIVMEMFPEMVPEHIREKILGVPAYAGYE